MSSVDPLAFLEEAVATPSHEDVEPMRTLLVETLEEAGVEPDVYDGGAVLAHRGSGDGGVVLNTHLDTVAPHLPLEREDDVIRGRGACDAKGPLSAMLGAFLDTAVGDGRLTLAVTPDEEATSAGAHALVADDVLGSPEAVVVGEPTGLDVCTAAAGRVELVVTIEGIPAHAATPDSGVNPIDALETVLPALRTFDGHEAAHPTLGAPSLTPTAVRGGDATNRTPERIEVVLDRRPVPPETAADLQPALAEHLREVVDDTVDLSVTLAARETPYLEAWETDETAPVVRALAAAAGGDVRPFEAATEASYFSTLAPTVVFGPGVLTDEVGAVAHSEREYVEIGDVERAHAALTGTLEALLASG